ncbi:uncharacterized protein LOC118205297 [Stegodyphus dumicola]|uniref:uncharacterized protein LOC118205297 n=1 Tax=Stegodyphus dumicola TaxID=202533 RepID=UPI0015ABF25A|nr:uncharacterized protein LOC118205297 [Stegodyphus dumicola]
MESVKVMVNLPNIGEVTFCAVYNHPGNKLSAEILDRLINSDSPTFLDGDLNAKHLDWGCCNSNYNGRIVHDFVCNYPVFLHVPDEPTYRQNMLDRRPDILDIFITTFSIPMAITVTCDMSSDHVPVLAYLGVENAKNLPPIKHTDWDLYHNTLMTTDLNCDSLQSTSDIERAITDFTQIHELY